MEDFEGIKELLDLIAKMKKEMEAHMAENRDDRPKEIGDIVIPWDASFLFDMDGNKVSLIEAPFSIHDEEENNKCIVISTGNEITYKRFSLIGDMDTPLVDLVICHLKSRNYYRIDSDSVKHLDHLYSCRL